MARRCAAKFYAIAANPCPLYPFLVTAPLDYLKLNNYLFYRDFLADSLAQTDQKTGKI